MAKFQKWRHQETDRGAADRKAQRESRPKLSVETYPLWLGAAALLTEVTVCQ